MLALPFLECGVQLGQFLPELVDSTVKQLLRYEQVAIHILLLNGVTALTGQDDQLAQHILSAKVDTRIGLAVTLLLGQADGLAQRNIGTQGAEYEVERTAYHSLDLKDMVTAVYQVVDGVYNRQACAHIGLKQELDTDDAAILFAATTDML